jgi:hypothetical protein
VSPPPDVPDRIAEAFEAGPARAQMTLDEAVTAQFRLVDTIQAVCGSDAVFTEDYGQVRALGTEEFGAGGRPRATARVEEILARYFGAEDAALVHGAGTGAVSAMLHGGLEPAARVLVHTAHPYKTTLPAMRHMGLQLTQADLGSPAAIRAAMRPAPPDAVYFQHVPQKLGDTQQPAEIVATVRAAADGPVTILVDDSYMAMRSPRIGVQLGADASAFSLFKLLASTNIGCVLGSRAIVSTIRRESSSAGCQVQGPHAMEALRGLVYAPVALAIQNQVVVAAAEELNRLIDTGELRHLRRAVAGHAGHRSLVLVFGRPVAESFLRSAWRNGSPSQSVGEEARYEVLPLFTHVALTYLRGAPDLGRFAIRINPLRGGPETIVRVVRAALDDREFEAAAALV